MPGLPPPPTNDQQGSYAWLEWFRQLRNYISSVGSVPWNIINFAGSSISDIANRSHQLLQSLQGGTTGQYYHLTQNEYAGTSQSNIDASKLLGNTWASPEAIGTGTAAAGTFTDLTSTGNTVLGDATSDTTKVSGNLILPKTSGYGIQVDTTTPTFGWRDLLGPIEIKTAGATDPIWAAYRGTIYAYTFDTATAEAFFVFHIPHDWVPSQAETFIHMHWSQNVVDTGGPAGVPGNVEWKFDISYADGHGTPGGAADPFTAPITVTVVQQASTTQYGHMIAEVAFANNGGTGGLLDTATIQVDGILLVRAYRVKANAADTLNQAPFGHTCDIHYQSTNLATKNKSPNFYV